MFAMLIKYMLSTEVHAGQLVGRPTLHASLCSCCWSLEPGLRDTIAYAPVTHECNCQHKQFVSR